MKAANNTRNQKRKSFQKIKFRAFDLSTSDGGSRAKSIQNRSRAIYNRKYDTNFCVRAPERREISKNKNIKFNILTSKLCCLNKTKKKSR